jgi:hypothetical protein
MQRRKEDSFPMVEVFVCRSGAWMFVVVAVVVVVVGWGGVRGSVGERSVMFVAWYRVS